MNSPDRTQENQTILDELLLLMSRKQLYLLIESLEAVRVQGHGEVILRVSGDRMFVSKKDSQDGGVMPRLNS